MKASVKNIAKLANVSPTAVSLVLNNKPNRVSRETKERILQAARELQYEQVNGVTELSEHDVKTIGLIVPDTGNAVYSEYITGAERFAYQCGYTMLQCNTDESASKCFGYLKTLVERQVRGIMIIPPRDMNLHGNNKKLLGFFNESSIPMLLLDQAVDRVFCDFVTVDNKQGAYLAVEHLIVSGHQKIGIITGPEGVYNARKRTEGYKEALSFYGMELKDAYIAADDFSPGSGEKAVELLVSAGVTAIFAGSGQAAFGVYRYARKKGIRIPEDLSVVGFDNIPAADLLDPPLTMIEQPAGLMGKRACELLISKIDKTADVGIKDYYFSPVLTERASVKKI